MKSRNILKCRYLCDFIEEKLLEFAEHIFYLLKRRRMWTSSLKECYMIYKKQRGKVFVEDFLKERERVSRLNRMKMEIINIEGEEKECIIGKVLLQRKKEIIAQAVLKTKNSDDETYKLIYWSFDN